MLIKTLVNMKIINGSNKLDFYFDNLIINHFYYFLLTVVNFNSKQK